MFRRGDRLYEQVWTRDGWKDVEVGREYPHQCVNCDAVISNLNRSKHTINGVPHKCEKCYRRSEIAVVADRIRRQLEAHLAARKQHAIKEARRPIREIHRDIAIRYIQRFNGSTFHVQTAADDSDIYLRNAFALTIAKVLATDKYPSQAPPVQDLPF